jgi:hypothetical protein
MIIAIARRRNSGFGQRLTQAPGIGGEEERERDSLQRCEAAY